MTQLPQGARAFTAALTLVGAALLVRFAEPPAAHHFPDLGILLFLAVATASLKLRLPAARNGATLPATFVVDFTALLVLGPHQALPIVAIGSLSQSLLGGPRRVPAQRTLFNIAASIISIETTGLVYHLFGGSAGVLSPLAPTAAVVAAAVTYFLVNTGLVAAVVSRSTTQSMAWVWRENFLGSGLNYFIGAAAAAVFALVMTNRLWSLVPLAAIPVYLTLRAYLAYTARLAEEHGRRQVFESINEGLAAVDRLGVVTLWNDALERILECGRERALGRRLTDVVPALAQTELPAALTMALAQGVPQLLDHFTLGRGATRRILEVRVFPFADGATIRWCDVTERAEAQQALKRSEERYALAALASTDGLWDWDLVSGEIYFSQRWRTLVGLTSEEGLSHGSEAWFSRVHAEDRTSLQEALQAHIRGVREQLEHEHRIVRDDGTCRWVLCRGAAVRNRNGRATRIVGSLTDVTKWAQSQERLREAALHDTLTGLPNRRMFTELLRQTLNRCREIPGRRCGVMFLDIDQFKAVNDTLGHLIGDELLMKVAERLRASLRDGDVLARLGGDEFTILLSDVQTANQACAVAFRVQDAIRTPISLGGRDLSVSASIGIAVSSREYTDPDQIMRDADNAMYRAKARGKARHEIFDAEMRAEDLERLTLETELRQALERRQLVLHYQPIVSLESGAWTGFEALVRWERGGRTLPPEQFIPLAEEIGIIEPVGAWVLQEACRQFAAWRRAYPESPLAAITVNVSPRQLLQSDFVAVVAAAVQASELAPGELRLEITETSLMARPELVADVLREIRGLGVQIYLDDFGTGFSSLSHLHRLPVDALKIDRSFVSSLKCTDRPAIVESILALARTLHTVVIAEGVETAEQLRELRRLGCGHAQGFLFSAPLPAAAAEEFLSHSTAVISEAARPGVVEADLPTALLDDDGAAAGILPAPRRSHALSVSP